MEYYSSLITAVTMHFPVAAANLSHAVIAKFASTNELCHTPSRGLIG